VLSSNAPCREAALNYLAIVREVVGADADVAVQSGLPLSFGPAGPNLDLSNYQKGWFRVSKRVFDVVASIVAILVLLPLLLILSALIALDSPGPVLFKQARWGKDGRIFTLYKFRSMHVVSQDATGKTQTTENDQRVSKLGRFLRRSSLDELPQLLNILIGDMSFVGPRPHPIRMLAGGVGYEALVPYYFERTRAVPGLTGWAQVNGFRGPTTDPKLAFGRIHHDLAYIQNASLALDLKILFLTVQREFLRGNGF
jgi:lipopolysaccharide/colanic/teichoic acid biosynthesis glycosyltransferase